MCTPKTQDPDAGALPSSSQNNLFELLNAPEEEVPADLEKIMESLEHELASMRVQLASQAGKGLQVKHTRGGRRASMHDPNNDVKGDPSAHDLIDKVRAAQRVSEFLLGGFLRSKFASGERSRCRAHMFHARWQVNDGFGTAEGGYTMIKSMQDRLRILSCISHRVATATARIAASSAELARTSQHCNESTIPLTQFSVRTPDG